MPLVAAILIVILGTLVIWGWMGYQTDDHPLCSGCGFDLTHMKRLYGQCPECGAQIYWRSSVVFGRRQRRTGVIAVAGSFLLLVMGLTASSIYFSVAEVSIQSYLPRLVLKYELGWSNWEAALIEVESRRKTRKLDAAELCGLADAVLDRQRDADAEWPTKLGDFIESLHRDGTLDAARYRRFVEGAVTLHVDVGTMLYDDGILPCNVRVTGRGPSSPLWFGAMSALAMAPDVSGAPEPVEVELKRQPSWTDATDGGAVLKLPAGYAAKPGSKLPVRVRVRYRTYTGVTASGEPTGVAIGEVTATADSNVELHLDQPFSRPVWSDELAVQIGKSFQPINIRHLFGTDYRIRFYVGNAPENLSYRLQFFAGDADTGRGGETPKEVGGMDIHIPRGSGSPYGEQPISLPARLTTLRAVLTPIPPTQEMGDNWRTYADVPLEFGRIVPGETFRIVPSGSPATRGAQLVPPSNTLPTRPLLPQPSRLTPR